MTDQGDKTQDLTKTHVVVLYTNSGGGHISAARTLRRALEDSGRYRVTLMNPYREVFSQLDVIKLFTGRTGEDVYNEKILRDGRTGLICWLFYATIKLNIATTIRPATKLLAAKFDEVRPDVVISVMPLVNTAMLRAIRRHEVRAERRVHGVVAITDWSEMLRDVWFPHRRDYHAICGTPISAQQARRLSPKGPRVHEMSGLLINPAFSRAPEKSVARAKLGLADTSPVVTVIYGGEGNQRMLMIARALADRPPHAQVVFICGRCETLVQELQAAQLPFAHKIVGFTDEVATYFAASDVFVGKPGPGSVSEAMAMNLWMILDAKMALPQEASVLRFVQTSELGQSFSSISDCTRAIDAALKASQVPPKDTVQPNTASHDAVQIIENIARLGDQQ